DVVERLDVMPLQVHIEAQVVEVKLSGDLKYGVNWFFEQAVDAPTTSGGAGLPSALGRDIWGDLAGSIGSGGASWTFLGRNAAARSEERRVGKEWSSRGSPRHEKTKAQTH